MLGEWVVVLSLAVNVICSNGIILVNKRLIFEYAGFRYGTVLTIIHFLATFAGCIFFSRVVPLFQPKQLQWWRVFPISCAFCGFVVFNNISLLTNSVTVYQVAKIFGTPLIIAINAIFYQTHESRRALLSLVPICVGGLLTVVSDDQLQFGGIVWALLAILSNALYTIWGKTKQVELQAEPMQLLLYQAPLSAFMLLWVAYPLDVHMTPSSVVATKATELPLPSAADAPNWFTVVWTIGLSCVLAFGLNFSFFFFVGRTSPLTMNLVGYGKTSLLFVLGFLLRVDTPTTAKVVGVTMTLMGLAMYTHVKHQQSMAANGMRVLPQFR